MPIGKLLVSMSLPMVISMLVQALYNVVDSVFVSYFDTDGLTAVSTIFPIQNLMIGVASGLGVGFNAIISRALGEKKQEQANEAARQGIFLEAIGYIIFLFIGLFFVGTFMHSQTSNQKIITYGIDYGMVCCVLSFGMFVQMTFERLLQSTGRTIYTMITQGLGAIIRFCIGNAIDTAVSAASLICATNTLSTILYKACTSIDITIGSDIVIRSLLTGITPILFSFDCIFSSITDNSPLTYYSCIFSPRKNTL